MIEIEARSAHRPAVASASRNFSLYLNENPSSRGRRRIRWFGDPSMGSEPAGRLDGRLSEAKGACRRGFWIVGAVVAAALVYLAWTYNRLVGPEQAGRRRSGATSTSSSSGAGTWFRPWSRPSRAMRGTSRGRSKGWSRPAIAGRAGRLGRPAAATSERGLSTAVGRFFAVAEAYPELKAEPNFQDLQKIAGRDREQRPVRPAVLQRRGPRPQYAGAELSVVAGGSAAGFGAPQPTSRSTRPSGPRRESDSRPRPARAEPRRRSESAEQSTELRAPEGPAREI